MIRLFKTRHFEQWMKKTELSDTLLRQSIQEIENGLIDADLGGGIVKKRIALPHRGKSGSIRTIIATNKNDRWFFLLGYEKNEQANINKKELVFLKYLAADLLALSEQELQLSLKNKILIEINNENTKAT